MANFNDDKRLRFIIIILCSALGLFLAELTPAAANQEGTDGLRPTPYSMDFYGYIEGARAGDIITVYDQEGTLSGKFTLTKDGQYGFLHVYGDDKSTEVDEGARKNEPLRFELNGSPLVPSSGEEIYWLGDGKKQRFDFPRR